MSRQQQFEKVKQILDARDPGKHSQLINALVTFMDTIEDAHREYLTTGGETECRVAMAARVLMTKLEVMK